MNRERWIRVALGYIALVSLELGVWALFAPRSFYDDFPGLGRTWVSVDGPYNEHLVRDVGGLSLALAIVVVAAFITLSRPMVVTASLAALAFGLPHFVYHVAHRDDLGSTDQLMSIGGLALLVAAAVAALALARRAT